MNIISQRFPYTHVYVDTSLQAAHVECEGYVPSDSFRKTLLHVIELIRTNQLVACVYDIRKLKSLCPHDQDWFIDEALPLILKTPLRKVAVLESALASSSLNLNLLVYSQYYSIPFELQYFEDVASSLEWISEPADCSNNAVSSARRSIASVV